MPTTWFVERFPALIVFVSLSFIALLVLSSNIRHRANQVFALFLLLVAGNFLTDALVSLAGATYDSTHPYVWIGYLLLLLDPAVLAYFVSIYPRPSRLSRSPWATAALFGMPAALAVAHATDPNRLVATPTTPWRWALFVYLASAYLYCLLRLVWLATRTPTSLLRRQLQFLLIAFGVALVPRVGLVVIELRFFQDPLSLGAVATKIAIAWLLLAFLTVLGLAVSDSAERRRLLQAMGAVASFLALITAIWILDYQGIVQNLFFTGLGYSSRWIIFSVLVGIALLQHRLFEYRTRLRDTLLLGSAFVALVVVLSLVPGALGSGLVTGGFRPRPLDLLLLVLIAGGAGTAPLFLRGFVRRRSSDEEQGPRALDRRLDAYRAVLETLTLEGRAQPERDDLRALRRNLGISMREHERLATLVAWQHVSGSRGPSEAPLARYEVERPLGEGTLGQAYLARERATGVRVVLKRLHPAVAHDANARSTLLREARILLRFDHPNVVRLHRLIESPEPILVLEYVGGGSLDDRLRTGERFDPSRTAALGRDLLAGLQEIHRQGILHRDLKPANVLLTEEGRAKICDFGIALAPDLTRTLQTAASGDAGAGTILYMSPERAADAAPTVRSDLYAVGALLYRALNGRPHIDLEGRGELEALRILAAGPKPLTDASMGPKAARFFEKALAPNPRQRFASADAMSQALEELAGASAKSHAAR